MDTSMEAGPSRSATAPSPGSVPETAFERWRLSLARSTGLGLTDQEKDEWNKIKVQRQLEGDWDRCESMKKKIMEQSECSGYHFDIKYGFS